MNNPSQTDRETIKENIRSRLDIVDVVGRYVSLKPAGQNMKARCPFHNERTPSFTVNPSRQIFHCFGCGKGGDVFTFLMEIEGLSFGEVIKRTAEETGIKLPSRYTENQGASLQGEISREAMFRIHEIAVLFYYSRIKGNTGVIDYFKERGLKPETVKDFRLGYAPEGWDGFLSFAASKGIKSSACVACGLAIPRPDGSAYDRFRDRIMFPVSDISGKTVAFGGRAFKDAEPKYLNSPETPLYHKNRTLYGLNKSRQSIKEKNCAIIVEGYMDFLGLYQAGITNCVATSGTALTTEHGKIIKRFASKAVIMFDGDQAGISAAERAVYLLAPAGLDVRVLTLPGNHDPDTFVLENSAAALLAMVENATPGIRYAISMSVKKNGIDTPQAKSQVVNQTARLAADTLDHIVASEYIREIAESTGVREQFVQDAVKKLRSQPNNQGVVQIPNTTDSKDDFLSGLEGCLLSLLVRYPALIDAAMEKISPETFTNPFSAELYSLITDTFREDPTLDSLARNLDNGEAKRVLSRIMIDGGVVDDPAGELSHILSRLETKRLKSAMRSISADLKSGKTGIDKDRLLREHLSIARKLGESGAR